jgi:Peptidase A4 family
MHLPRSVWALAALLAFLIPFALPPHTSQAGQSEQTDLQIQVIGLQPGSQRNVIIRVTNVSVWWSDKTVATVQTVSPNPGNQQTFNVPDINTVAEAPLPHLYEFTYTLAGDCNGSVVKATLSPGSNYAGVQETNLSNNVDQEQVCPPTAGSGTSATASSGSSPSPSASPSPGSSSSPSASPSPSLSPSPSASPSASSSPSPNPSASGASSGPSPSPSPSATVAVFTAQVAVGGASPSPSSLTPTLTNGQPVLTLAAADSGQPIVVPVGTSIFLHFGSGDYAISVDPPTGVLEAPQGAFALANDDIGLLVAVGPGSATITVQAPPAGTPTAAPSTSGNWSGYVATSTTYTNIGGSWVVPSVQPTPLFTASSSWIGIDGNSNTNTNLIQTGTEQDYTPGSGASYDAWWEILPAAETKLSTSKYPVKPGDQMFAEINQEHGSTWYILLEDHTAGWAFSIEQTYSGPLTSAEWIQEATAFGSKGKPAVPAILAKYGSIPFTRAFDNDPDGETSPDLDASEELAMVQGSVQVSTPSTPVCTANGFTVAYGATQPPNPASCAVATVPPHLSLSAPTVTAGNTVQVTGQSFANDGAAVSLTLTGPGSPVTLGTATVSQGGFSTTVTIPPATSDGNYTIHAQSSGAQADVSIQVTVPSEKQTLTVTDGTGAVATSIATDTDYTLTGNNFAPGFGVTVYLDTYDLLDPSKTGPQLGMATAGLPDESFTMPFDVTAAQIGSTNGNHTFLVVSEGHVIARLTMPFMVLHGPG